MTVGLRLGAAVAIGTGDEPGVLDFLIDGLLQKRVKLFHFSFDLGDVTELDFNGDTEAVAAVMRQADFLL